MSKEESLRCVVLTQATGPAGSTGRWISRKNAAAARDQQKRGAIPVTEKFGLAIESEPLSDGAKIEFQPAD